MGHSPSIAQMQEKEKEFKTYLDGLEADLKAKAAGQAQDLQTEIDKFYSDNKYDDAVGLVSGSNVDFQHQSDFTMDNLKKVIDAISSAVFSGAGLDQGTGATVDESAVDKLGAEVEEMSNLELYVAGKVFDVLSKVVLSFGASTSITYTSSIKSESLGYGLQIFTAVAADSYKSESFFNKETIFEYLYTYQVKFSKKQADAEVKMSLVELYQDQIATYKGQEEALLKQLSSGAVLPSAFATTKKIYDDLITESQEKMHELDAKAKAAALGSR